LFLVIKLRKIYEAFFMQRRKVSKFFFGFVSLSEVEDHGSSSAKIGDLDCGVTCEDSSFFGMTNCT